LTFHIRIFCFKVNLTLLASVKKVNLVNHRYKYWTLHRINTYTIEDTQKHMKSLFIIYRLLQVLTVQLLPKWILICQPVIKLGTKFKRLRVCLSGQRCQWWYSKKCEMSTKLEYRNVHSHKFKKRRASFSKKWTC